MASILIDDHLPLLKSSTTYSDRYHSKSIYQVAQRYLRTIIQSKETRKVFFFLVLNISFTFVEFLYGYWTNSLGLTADAVHMLFDSTAIVLSLVASVITRWEPDTHCSYGYGRVETLTGFINALALVFASANIVWEAVERFFDPRLVESNKLLVVSVLGLLVNLVGIFAFDHGHSHSHNDHSHSHDDHSHNHDHHSHSHDHHRHDHSNPLMHGMFLHILSDTLGSVGVILSSLLIQWFGWTWSDPLCSIFISVLTIITAWPLLRDSGNTLLQRVPSSLERDLPTALRRVEMVPGVADMSQPHFWELNQGFVVVTLKIRAKPNADAQKIRLEVASIFKDLSVRDLTIQVDYDIMTSY